MSQTTKVIIALRWPLVVLLLHVIVTYYGLYWRIAHIDKLMHLLGGMSIASSWLRISEDLKIFAQPRFLVSLLVTLGIVSLAAICWELMEFSLDQLAGTMTQVSLADTMNDLATGLLGGVLTSLSKIIFARLGKDNL